MEYPLWNEADLTISQVDLIVALQMLEMDRATAFGAVLQTFKGTSGNG
jgi:hypothetical protein